MDAFEPDIYSNYKYIDVAFGGAEKRNNLIDRSELEARLQTYSAKHKPVDCFATYFGYPDAMLEFFGGNGNSVKGYDGLIYSETIPIDIDDRIDLSKAHVLAKKVLYSLEDQEIDPNTLKIYFSGSKGFHIEIPSVLFGIKPSVCLNEAFKRIVQRLLPDMPFDPVNYDKVRLWRLPGTINSKTGLYKIPLSVHELLTCSIDDIKRLAARPRNGANPWEDDVELNTKLNTLYRELECCQDQSSESISDKHISLENLFRCDFIKHCYDDRKTLPEPYWYHAVGIIIRLSEGREYVHAISQGYPGYSRKETDEKILHALDGSPVTCEYIHRILDFTCAKDCGVRSPAVLLSKKTVSIEEPIWPEPAPFNEYSLPQFPVHVLPPWCRDMVQQVAEVNQVDMGLAGSIGMGVLSTCIAKRARIDLLTHQEPANLYVAPICESGERKSSTMGMLTEPLYRFQAESEKIMAPIVAEYQTDVKILQSRLEKLEKDAARLDGTNADKCRTEARILARQISEIPAQHLPVFIADDITTEQVGILAFENGERLSFISSEGGIFNTMAGRYSSGYTAIDIYLKGHAGDPWSNERVGRKRISMTSPALTLCLAVQPEIIKQIGGNREFHGRGLLARFLYAHCPSRAGYRMRQTKRLDAGISDTYRKMIYGLMRLPSQEAILMLARDAQEKWDRLYNDIERQMCPGGKLEPIKEWGSKLAGAIARIAALLHFAEHMENAPDRNISVNIVDASGVIGFYYLEHALAAFGLMNWDERVETAKKILEYLLLNNRHSFKGRDVLRHKNIFKTIDDVQPGIKVLIDRGYIRAIDREYNGRGRPESITYAVNPLISPDRHTTHSIDKIDIDSPKKDCSSTELIDNNDKTAERETFVNIVNDPTALLPEEDDEPITVDDSGSEGWEP